MLILDDLYDYCEPAARVLRIRQIERYFRFLHDKLSRILVYISNENMLCCQVKLLENETTLKKTKDKFTLPEKQQPNQTKPNQPTKRVNKNNACIHNKNNTVTEIFVKKTQYKWCKWYEKKQKQITT